MKVALFSSTDADYAAIAAVHNAAYPNQPLSAEGLQQADQRRDRAHFFERYVGVIDGQIVVHGEIGHTPWSFRPNKYRMGWDCHPDWEISAEIPFINALYQMLLKRSPDRIQLYIRQDRERLINHIVQLGFSVGLRDTYSELLVAAFDATAYDGLYAKLHALGIRFVTLRDLLALPNEDWKAQLFAADWASAQDIPTDEPLTQRSVDAWWSDTHTPDQPLDGYIAAISADGTFIGMSNVKTGVGKTLSTDYTGVRPEWRRKGVATALKVRIIQFAKEHDYGSIQTDNEETNPMLKLNLQLGFKQTQTWCNYVQIFSEDLAAVQS